MTATYATQRTGNVFNPASTAQSRDALKIAVATARNVQIDDNAVVHFNFYKTAACADRCIFNFHN